MKSKTLRSWHTYLGIGTGVFFLALSVTGILLAFRGSFSAPRPVVPAHLQDVPRLPVEGLLSKAKGVVDAEVAYISFPKKARDPIRIGFRDEFSTTLYQAPNGEVVETRDNRRFSFNGFILDLHTGAILGRPGELFMAFAGFCLILSLLTGTLIWPWWLKARKKKARVSASISRQPSKVSH